MEGSNSSVVFDTAGIRREEVENEDIDSEKEQGHDKEEKANQLSTVCTCCTTRRQYKKLKVLCCSIVLTDSCVHASV